MKILIDECLPSELKEALTEMGHESQTDRQAGFGSKKNGELLTIAEGRWEVPLTSDHNIKYQQNMTGRKVSIVILRAKSNRTTDVADARLRASPASYQARSSGRNRPSLATMPKQSTSQVSSYYRAGYYDPNIGRFLSEDPARADIDLYRYAYVQNGPKNKTLSPYVPDCAVLREVQNAGPRVSVLRLNSRTTMGSISVCPAPLFDLQ